MFNINCQVQSASESQEHHKVNNAHFSLSFVLFQFVLHGLTLFVHTVMIMN